jgi:hypothetical protein
VTNDTAMTPISPAQLAKWYEQSDRANEEIRHARMQIATEQADMGDGRSVDDRLFEAQELTADIHCRLHQMIGPQPAEGEKPTDRSEFAIPLLQLDTPKTRELLDLLERAQAVAEEVDADRGRALPLGIELQPGESRGTDLAENISYLALRVRTEVHGRADLRQE